LVGLERVLEAVLGDRAGETHVTGAFNRDLVRVTDREEQSMVVAGARGPIPPIGGELGGQL